MHQMDEYRAQWGVERAATPSLYVTGKQDKLKSHAIIGGL